MVFPSFTQLDAMDCGPTSLKIVAQYYGKHYSLQNLRERCHITREGVSLLGISDAAESIGFRTTGVKMTWEQLREKATLPCIVHWNQQHFVVVYKIVKIHNGWEIHISDPAAGLLKYREAQFLKSWIQSDCKSFNISDSSAAAPSAASRYGIALLLEPTPAFYREKGDEDKRLKLGYLLQYLRPYKSYLAQLALAMLTASILSLILPFLTQSVVDKGIGTGNLSFVVMMLVAQVVLTLSQLANNLIRSWLMLHMTVRISISLISDFLAKLMRLPIAFFDSKMVGDIMQRIDDYDRIQSFLTGSLLSMAMAVVSFVIYGAVMGGYDPDDTRHLPVGQCALHRLDSALHEAPPQARLHALPRGGSQPEQYRAAHRRHAGHQAQRLRKAETLGMGAHPGAAVPGLHQRARAGADAGGGRHVHRSDQERRHLVPRRLGRHRGPHDPRHDGRPAIYHRPAQRTAVAVHPVRAGDAGCEDLARTPLGDSGERRRGAQPRKSASA